MNIKKWFERSSKAVKETARTIKDTYVLPKDGTDMTRNASEGMLYMQTPDGKTVITISISNRRDEIKAKKLVSLALGEDNDVERFIGLTE
ncbi:MAG: hypothetical protein U0L58_10570 [Ruminococcus sp.]|nr:hypothetical protein [Ruminococcus sp.]